ncbi:MAG: glycosyltransferase family 2 protein [Flavobacterium sp.]|nr:glycosyltransferase family 2 protein [Flavobacterium sp.]
MLVSIIIPLFNQEKFLNETLESVLSQTYSNWECLVIDDGSTDNSAEIAKKWVGNDKRFKYFFKNNSGVSAARNFGLKNAKGDYIQFLDSDDFLYKEKLSLSMQIIIEKKLDIVCTNYKMCTDFKEKPDRPFSQLNNFEFNLNNIMIYWNDGFTIPIHCFLFKSKLFDDIQFPEGLTAQEDWATWIQIYKNKPTTFFLDETLVLYRINPFGRTNTSGFFEETLQVINYLKSKLSDREFNILNEATTRKYYNAFIYWRSRERNIKQSNTYKLGLFFKKILLKLRLLALFSKIFNFINKNI